MHLPDTSRGKHVRCSGCQEIVLATTESARNAHTGAAESRAAALTGLRNRPSWR